MSHAPVPTVGAPIAVAKVAPDPGLPGDLSGLRASIRAPSHFDYDPQSLGAAAHFVSIHIENVGSRAVPIADLHASFATTREGVAFPCNTHVRAPAGALEPVLLYPAQSTTFERLLDCSMPLPGHYEVRVRIHTGERESEVGGSQGAGVFVGAFAVDVVANGNVPRPVSSRVGLYAEMTGAPTAPPMPADAWAKGGYRVVVALMNGSDHSVAVGPAHVSMLVFKQGSALPCTGQRQHLAEPDSLKPGAVHVERVPVTCAPTEEGRYEIVGRLAVGNEQEVEIGRVGLLVTQSPYFLFTPERPNDPLPTSMPTH